VSNPTLDFTGVEALRKHMLLNLAQMATLLGVSRATYFGWTNGKPIRKTNEAKARAQLKKMLVEVTENDWPTPEIIAMSGKQRMQTLLERLAAEA